MNVCTIKRSDYLTSNCDVVNPDDLDIVVFHKTLISPLVGSSYRGYNEKQAILFNFQARRLCMYILACMWKRIKL